MVFVFFLYNKSKNLNRPCSALDISLPNVLDWLSLIFLPSVAQLEDVEVTLADQIQKVSKANFAAAWEEAAESGYCEMEDMFALSSMTSIEQAVSSVISFLGLQPAERSDKVPQGKSSHTLYLAGELFFSTPVRSVSWYSQINFATQINPS